MNRIIVSARCAAKGHLLAQVVACPDGLRLVIPRPVVAVRGKPGEIRSSNQRRDQDTPFPTPDVDSMTYAATCACGAEYEIAERALAAAIRDGVSNVHPQSG